MSNIVFERIISSDERERLGVPALRREKNILLGGYKETISTKTEGKKFIFPSLTSISAGMKPQMFSSTSITAAKQSIKLSVWEEIQINHQNVAL